MFKFIVQVGTTRTRDGVFSKGFDSLDDAAREWIKARAASFRSFDKTTQCEARILRNGTSEVRVLAC